MRLRIAAAAGAVFHPSVLVHCEPLNVPAAATELTPARLIIEVLSPTTQHFDRGPKLLAYQQVAGLSSVNACGFDVGARFDRSALPAIAAEPSAAGRRFGGVGGGTSAPTALRPYVDWSLAADGIWHAARLFHAGKLPLLVLSGGSGGEPTAVSEAQAIRLLLLDLGVPDSAKVLEEYSGNTRQNGGLSAANLAQRGVTRVLLVRSALYTARSRTSAHFEAAGPRANGRPRW